ncbi:MAG: M1 family aminopeptidase [Terriglobales bacterium]
MTEVIVQMRGIYRIAACVLVLAGHLVGQALPNPSSATVPALTTLTRQMSPAEDLFLRLGRVGLDKSQIYRVRNVSIDRGGFSISLNDGVIGFTEEVAGQVTGAFFEGEGEILLSPPNQVERGSMALQTGAAILEESFHTAFFRFNDNTYRELLPSLVAAEHGEEYVAQWNPSVHNLCDEDALRLLVSFSQYLPAGSQGVETRVEPATSESKSENNDDEFFHARMEGRTKGNFDVYFDSTIPEPVWAGQLRTVDGVSYYDVWTSFSLPRKNEATSPSRMATEASRAAGIEVSQYRIRAEVKPPTTIDAEAVLQLQVLRGGRRAVVFELARSLLLKQVEANGHPVEFIHNPAMEGTQLARRGNDLVAVIFPQPLRDGQRIELRFVYGGDVLSEAGTGLLYVGARGTWYPNRGLSMSNFEMEFHYPPGWTLVATGKRLSTAPASSPSTPAVGVPGEQVSWWASERPIPIAGFNLGRFQRVIAHAGDVTVATYATGGVERDFPSPGPQVILPDPAQIIGAPRPPPQVIEPIQPSPARNAQMVANASAHAIESFSRRFGPYPYSELSLTQMPGTVSQGWPALIFLSSLTFLTDEEKSRLHMDPVEKTILKLVIPHETAHQWWGDLVLWSSYRDQWISEALANYSSLMLFEAEDSHEFHLLMDKYRDDLLQKNKAGQPLMEDGAVTLGMRLSCSEFPNGYEAISYGRGTWLLHMLRYMLRDAERKTGGHGESADHIDDEPFVRALRRVRERYQGRAITSHELLQVFEEDLPRSLWFEGHKSLDWFYDGWISGTAVPRFEVRAVKYTDKPGETSVSGTLLQKDAPEDLVTPVPLYASVGGKLLFLGRIFADGAETPFRLSAPAGTRKIVVDPNQTLLARGR